MVRPRPTGEKVFWCEHCDDWSYEYRLSEETYYVHDTDYYVRNEGGYMYFQSDCTSETKYKCNDCDNFLDEEPEIVRQWRCEECGSSTGDVDRAKECCT